MKKIIYVSVAVLILLFQCYKYYKSPKGSDHAAIPVSTVEVTVEPTEEVKPVHSPLYIEGVSTQQIIEYFAEAVLSSEYSEGGNSNLVQKWTTPVYYKVEGNYTKEDSAVLGEIVSALNAIDGFPGMKQTDSGENYTIKFVNADEFETQAGDYVNHEIADGSATWWYDDAENCITNVLVFVRNDIEQENRTSVIQEEIINSLGLGNDSMLREDSIIYQGVSFPQQPSDIDMLLIKLLYSAEISCGMNYDECASVIEKLYY